MAPKNALSPPWPWCCGRWRSWRVGGSEIPARNGNKGGLPYRLETDAGIASLSAGRLRGVDGFPVGVVEVIGCPGAGPPQIVCFSLRREGRVIAVQPIHAGTGTTPLYTTAALRCSRAGFCWTHALILVHLQVWSARCSPGTSGKALGTRLPMPCRFCSWPMQRWRDFPGLLPWGGYTGFARMVPGEIPGRVFGLCTSETRARRHPGIFQGVAVSVQDAPP